MRTVITTINAKYIHTSLAIRLLYTVAKETSNISFQEFTIKEEPCFIAQSLLACNPDIIGIGVYIWSVKQTLVLVEELKRLKPELIIILGGPEISYEPEYFLNNWQIDYTISGDGEFAFRDLLYALEIKSNIHEIETNKIDGVSTKKHISKTIARADLKKIEQYDSPYKLPEDKKNITNKIAYIETSRGCPYQCQYCLSSLEKGIRFFSKEYVFSNIKYLIDNGVKTLKFLDRTFNLDNQHTDAIFDFMIKNYRNGLTCQFEIYADLLTPKIIDKLNNILPPNYFRFEIGIQSTHTETNIEVKRKQNFNIVSENILHIMNGGKIDLHLDLIAGLPFETYSLFVKSFNAVFHLKAKEVQLGFLKMLRGTNLRKNAENYGYLYSSEAPYEIISNNYISKNELKKIHIAEHMLEKFWNSGKFKMSMNYIVENIYKHRYFEFFEELAEYFEKKNIPNNIKLEELFSSLQSFLESIDCHIFPLLRLDYYSNFRIRPQGFWKNQINKKERKQLLYKIANDKNFLAKHGLNRKIIEKQMTIDLWKKEGQYLLTLFDGKTKNEIHNTYFYEF